MLEYFTYKKIRKHKAEKEAKKAAADAKNDAINAPSTENSTDLDGRVSKLLTAGSEQPVLHEDDERFIEDLLSNADDEEAPPLPPRLNVADLDWPTDNEVSGDESVSTAAANKLDPKSADTKKKSNRLSLLFSRGSKKNDQGLKPDDGAVTPNEAEREKHDLSRVLDRLNLSAKNNKVISTNSSDLLQKFTNVFKDLVNGVPTAVGDLTSLIEDRDGAISKGFDKLPSSLQKLVTQLPDKITQSLGPEILAAAAASQGIKADTSKGFKGAAKNMIMPHNLAELVTKPGALVGMLRAIVEALKTRWPAFIGMNVLWSVALSLLLFVLWYCHKRGREVRLEKEKSDAEAPVDGADRIEELPDDLALPAPETIITPPEETTATTATVETVTAPASSAQH